MNRKVIFALALFLLAWTLACGGGAATGRPSADGAKPLAETRSEPELTPVAPRAVTPSETGPAPAKPATKEAPEKPSPPQSPVAEPTPSPEARPGGGQPTATPVPQQQVVPPSGQQTAKEDPAPQPEDQAPANLMQPFEPSKDGFGFANFSGGTGSASILVHDLVELFGADGLCIPGEPGRCAPYPGVQLFLEQLNGVLANGLCYGISASVTSYFSGDLKLGDLDSGTVNVVDLRRDDELDHSIAKLHMMQFSEEYREFLDTYLAMQPEEIAGELLYAFEGLEDKLTPPYTLALYSEEGGHSVTPIGIEETGPGYRVFVYDSNWPREARWVDIDSGQGSWSYQALSEDKESGDELWEGEGAGSMALIPHMIPESGFHCFFCQAPGTGVSRGTGSVIILNTTDITNVIFEMSSDAGEVIKWTTSGTSGGLAGVKTYLLPSGSEAENSKGDTLMVFIPAGLDNFEVDVNGSNSSDKNDPFELILTGPGIPTTFVKGYVSGESEEAASKMLAFSRDLETDASDLVIDSENVETIEAATLQSTTFVEPSEGERYESSVVEGMLKDVQIIDNETSIVVHSLKSALNAVDTPLRVTETGDGLKFFKFSDGSIKIESSDGDVITKPEDGGYAVAFSDGATASFEINEEGSMIGAFSDGSTSIRFEAGNGVHSTADGWIINEPFRGVYEVFMEVADGVLESASAEDLMQLTSIARETKEVMARIMAGEFGESASSIRDDGSNAEGTLVNSAKQLEEMSEKYDFLKRVRENLAAKQPEGITAESVLRDMLGLMQSGTWSWSSLAGAVDESLDGSYGTSDVPEGMPSLDDMCDTDMGDMDMGCIPITHPSPDDMGDMDVGGMVQSYDPENIPQIATANFTELDKFSKMSKLRSAVGHDFSFNTSEYDPTGSNCKSIKHYFVPMGVPLENYLYSKTPHAFEWMSIKFFAPVDGTLQDIQYTQNTYGTAAQFTIRSSEYPGYYFRFFHIALDPNLTEGTLVKSGQQVGKLGNEEAWGEIAVEVRITSREWHYISFLQVATDDVLEVYKNRGVNTASDVIITKEQRDANPLACETNTEARQFEGSGLGGTRTDERFITWAFESSDNWFFFD